MPAIATIGFFDGVHKGHRYLFDQLRSSAAQYDERPLIFTFLQHPRTVLARMQESRADAYMPSLLTTVNERENLLGQFGDVHFFDFAEVQPLTALQFLDYLADRWKVRHLLMGYNHRFGSDGNLTDEQYAAVAAQVGIRIVRAQPYAESGLKPSSTIVRRLLEEGNITHANALLGYDYMLSGRVVHGRMIGRQIGFPTANIVPDAGKLIPADGVYEVQVTGLSVEAQSAHPNPQTSVASSPCSVRTSLGVSGLLNIGTNPTVGNTNRTIEVHIPGFDGDLYNRTLTLNFVRRLRGEIHFNTIDDLRAQIQCDLNSILS